MKPVIKPKRLKRKPTTEVPTFQEWKGRWEITHTNPIPMGNPYSQQPLMYYAKRELYSKKLSRKEKYEAMTPDITTVVPNLPDLTGRIVLGRGAKLVGRLHPVVSAVMLVDDLKTLYTMLKR